MVTGGQRSGKSEFAERLILGMSDHPLYLATAEIADEEFAERVRRHRARRGPEWENIDEPFPPGIHDLRGRTILLDCVTLWASNLFFRHGEKADKAYEAFCEDFERLIATGSRIIFVTNEIGLGGVSENAMRRHFTDLQGRVNSLIASRCDEVYMCVSGIPVKIK